MKKESAMKIASRPLSDRYLPTCVHTCITNSTLPTHIINDFLNIPSHHNFIHINSKHKYVFTTVFCRHAQEANQCMPRRSYPVILLLRHTPEIHPIRGSMQHSSLLTSGRQTHCSLKRSLQRMHHGRSVPGHERRGRMEESAERPVD